MRIPAPGDTIVACSTAPGSGAIAVIRLSGPDAVPKTDLVFRSPSKGKRLQAVDSHTAHFGQIMDGDSILDEVVATVFRAPNSYTGEDTVEISCHGSVYIQQRLVELFLDAGLRHAEAGEFTLRAFRNGKLDLSQSEAVADLIASQSKLSHDLALDQMRGGYSRLISDLRQQLLEFTALIELELDFSEEDVEFANRGALKSNVSSLGIELEKLISSFSLGNVIKKGIPVAIIGKPNVGKSTLLNALLNEEKAIVSEIPGTTRDAIEDTIVIEGIPFRFIDTAGLRESEDAIETIGIARTKEKVEQARIVLCVFDISRTNFEEIREMRDQCATELKLDQKKVILVANKTDMLGRTPERFRDLVEWETVFVSAKRRENIHLLSQSLVEAVDRESLQDSSLVSNARHYEALKRAKEAIDRVARGLDNELSSDLLTTDIRDALYHLGSITGEVTTDEILGTIFSRFCIGK